VWKIGRERRIWAFPIWKIIELREIFHNRLKNIQFVKIVSFIFGIHFLTDQNEDLTLKIFNYFK